MVEPEKCRACRSCEFACSVKNYGEANPARSRIHVVVSQKDGVIGSVPVVCQQCADPMCASLCPAGAIARNPDTGAMEVDAGKCLGCRMCVEVCPFGAPSADPRTGTSEKCDLCGGDPMCVKFCAFDAIRYVEAEEESMTRRRDLVAPYLQHLTASKAVGGE